MIARGNQRGVNQDALLPCSRFLLTGAVYYLLGVGIML
jgi:hypothetical protein